jgi:ribonuclease HI
MLQADQLPTASPELTNDLVAVSDGGYLPNQEIAAYGWTIQTSTKINVAEGAGRVQGFQLSSFRAEAYGMLSMIQYINRLPNRHKVHMYTDSKSLIQRCQQPASNSPHRTMQPDSDVIDTIKQEIRNSKHKLDIKHVKGHQDRNTAWEKLSHQAQLNVRADKLATIALSMQPQKFQPLIYHNVLYWRKQPITKSDKTVIRNAVHEEALKTKLLTALEPGYKVDWKALQQARSQTAHIQRFTTKMMHNWLPTYSRIAKQTPGHTAICPLCKQTDETTMHVFCCSAHPFKEKVLTAIRHAITDQLPADMHNSIIDTIDNHLEPVLKGLTPAYWHDNEKQPWKASMIRLIWTAAHEHWTIRCKKVQELPSEYLQQEISALYQQQDKIATQNHAHIYHVPLDKLLASTKEIQSTWLENYRSTVSRLATATTAAINSTQDIMRHMLTRVAGVQRVDSISDLERMD